MSWILVNLTNIEEILKKDPYLLRYYHKGVTKAADKLYWCHKILHATTLTEFNHKLKAEERKQYPPWEKKKRLLTRPEQDSVQVLSIINDLAIDIGIPSRILKEKPQYVYS